MHNLSKDSIFWRLTQAR